MMLQCRKQNPLCLHLCLSQSLFLSPGCFVFQGTPSWLKSRNAAVGIGISFHPHNCQQVRVQHLQRESWQARSQLWLTLENNNNIHLGVWNYLSRLVEVLPKAKKKGWGNHPMNNVLSSQPITTNAPREPINSVNKNKQYSRCYNDYFAFLKTLTRTRIRKIAAVGRVWMSKFCKRTPCKRVCPRSLLFFLTSPLPSLFFSSVMFFLLSFCWGWWQGGK